MRNYRHPLMDVTPTPSMVGDYGECRSALFHVAGENHVEITATTPIDYRVLECVEDDQWLDALQRNWKQKARQIKEQFGKVMPTRPRIAIDLDEQIGDRYSLIYGMVRRTVDDELIDLDWDIVSKPPWRVVLWSIKSLLPPRRESVMMLEEPIHQWHLCLLHAALNRTIERLARETDLTVRNRMRLLWDRDTLLGWDIEEPHRDIPAS